MSVAVISINKNRFADKADFPKPSHAYNTCHTVTIKMCA